MPGKTCAEQGDNFVWDIIAPLGEVVDGDFAVALLSEEDDFLADGNGRYIGDIDHDDVHANRADNSAGFSADEDVGFIGHLAVVSIGIPDRREGDARGGA